MAFNSRGGQCDLQSYNRYYVNRMPLRKHDNISIVKHDINLVVRANGWIVFLTHSGMKRDYDADYVEEIIEYCKNQGMKYVTVNEAYELLHKCGNLRENETKDWTIMDEISDIVYKHLWYILTILSCFIIIVIYFKYNKH